MNRRAFIKRSGLFIPLFPHIIKGATLQQIAALQRPGINYLLSEDFETGVAPVGWNHATGHPTYNYQPAIVGNYSCKLEATSETQYTLGPFVPTNPVWFYFKFKILQLPANDDVALFDVDSGLSSFCCDVRLNKSGALRANILGGSDLATVNVASVGTVYHCWCKYAKASASPGGDGFMSVSFVEAVNDTEVPTTSGNSYRQVTNGVGTLVADNLGPTLAWGPGNNTIVVYDKIRVSASPFTGVPA